MKPLRLTINGYGRIGRCLLRALHESPLSGSLKIVAINEPADLASMAYLTRFDSTHGRFPGQVDITGDGQLRINHQAVAVTHATIPNAVDWQGLGVDLVVECSGQYATRPELEAFLQAGAPRLLLSQPGLSAEDIDRTIIQGVNESELDGLETLVSAGSCTTNAVVPILHLLQKRFGIENVMLTTLHSVMNDQPVIDGYHRPDLRCTRSAMQSMVPVATGLARGVERLLPELRGRIQAKSIRVPVPNVSAIDLTATLNRPTDAGEINQFLSEAARGSHAGLLACANEPCASVDFNHHPESAIVDLGQTRVSGKYLLNMLIWFDNEWGFANRMLELAAHWQRLLDQNSPHTCSYPERFREPTTL